MWSFYPSRQIDRLRRPALDLPGSWLKITALLYIPDAFPSTLLRIPADIMRAEYDVLASSCTEMPVMIPSFYGPSCAVLITAMDAFDASATSTSSQHHANTLGGRRAGRAR